MIDAITQPILMIILITTTIIRGILSITLLVSSIKLLPSEDTEPSIAIIRVATVLLMMWRVAEGISEPVFTAVNAHTMPITIAGINWT